MTSLEYSVKRSQQVVGDSHGCVEAQEIWYLDGL